MVNVLMAAAGDSSKAPQWMPARESASPPISGMNQMPAASISTACTAFTPR